MIEAAAPVSKKAMTKIGFSYFPRKIWTLARGWIKEIGSRFESGLVGPKQWMGERSSSESE